MKKYLLLFVSIIVFGTMQAQKNEDHNGFMKSDKYISGLIGFSTISNADDVKIKQFEVSPRFGYFISDFIAIGGRLGYGYYHKKNSAGARVAENSTFTVEAFGRYYLLPGSKFSVFGELGIGFGSTKNIAGNWTNGINVGFTPGLSYFINQHFAVEFGIGVLSYDTVKPEGGNGSTDSFAVGVNLENINFGIIYKL